MTCNYEKNEALQRSLEPVGSRVEDDLPTGWFGAAEESWLRADRAAVELESSGEAHEHGRSALPRELVAELEEWDEQFIGLAAV